MATHYLPVCLNLQGLPVLVVGAGQVGAEKVRDLLQCGARVTVVSPTAPAWIRAEAEAGSLTLQLRPWRSGDGDGAFLAVAATDDPTVNAAVYHEAEAAGRLANACDDPEHCRFVFASRIERGPLTISVFTHGAAPVLSRRVRRDLEGWLGPEYAELAHLVAEVRTLLKQAPGLSQPARQRILERIVYGEALHLLREGQPEEARARIGEILREMAPGVA